MALESVLSLEASRVDSKTLVEITGLDTSQITIGEKISDNDKKKSEQFQGIF